MGDRARAGGPRWLRLCGTVGLVAAAVLAEREGWLGRTLQGESAGPNWIWVPNDLRDPRPVAVYFVRDFELAEPLEGAWVEVAGDAEYVLSLNGHRIGSSRFELPGTLDRFVIGPWLRAGTNRLLAEVRSTTGAGGFTLTLRKATEEVFLESDDAWSLARSYLRNIEQPAGPYRGEPVRVLGRCPVGRWGGVRRGPFQATFEEELAADEVRTARRYRISADPQAWQPLSQAPHGTVDLGPLVEFDFGSVETGYLQLSIAGQPLGGLAFFGTEPFERIPERTEALVLPVLDRGLWQDAQPRRFRYVLTVGLDGVRSAGVLPMKPSILVAWEGRFTGQGLWGLRPPPSRAPVEHVIRSELQHLASRS